MVYMPILKGKEGEFRALEQLNDARSLPLLPVFEVPPSTAPEPVAATTYLRPATPPWLAAEIARRAQRPSRRQAWATQSGLISPAPVRDTAA